MFGSEILEVAIGLVFVFLIASLVATAFREGVEAILKTRAVQLERGIRQLLDDKDGNAVTKSLFDHPLLYGLYAGDYDPGKLVSLIRNKLGRGSRDDAGGLGPAGLRVNLGTNLPAYVPSRNFALALLDVVASDGSQGAGVLSLEAVKANAMTLPDGRLRQAILLALAEGKDDIDRVRTSLEAWFDGNMDRVSGWYKRETQWILLAIGFVLAIAFNINSLEIAHDLSTNNTLRQSLVAKVDAAYPGLRTASNPNPTEAQLKSLSEADLRKQVDGLSDVIGWSHFWKKVDDRATRETAKKAAKAKAAEEKARKAGAVKGEAAEAEAAKPSRAWIASGYLLGSLPGWVLTAIAVSLGAPFWFDLLNKFMVIRSTVKPYEKSPPEGSEDRAGSVPSADRLAPSGPARTGAAGGPPPDGGRVGDTGAGQPPPEPISAALRIAFDTRSFEPGTLAFTVAGKTVPVPPDGFVEPRLAVGREQSLEATGQSGGKVVKWARTLTPGLDDEAQPVEAVLA